MLTVEQTKFIVSEVEKEGIHYSHLSDDIVDHLCCDIEHEMENGIGFGDAYKRVQARIGYKGLKQIQKDTLFLIDKTYRKMKTTMKISGFAGPALLGMGSLFKIFHWPGASIMLVLGFFVLCFLFLPTATHVMYKETKSNKNLLVYILGFIASVVFSLGVLFKVQHWPGASMMLTLSVVTGLALFLPALLFAKIKQANSKRENWVYVILYLAVFIHFAGGLFKIMHWPGASILVLVGNSLLFLVAVPMYLVNISKESKYITGKSLFVVFASVWIIISTNLVSIKTSGNIFRNYMAIDEQMSINASMLDAINQEFVDKSQAPHHEKYLIELREQTVKINKYLEEIKKDFVFAANNGIDTAGTDGVSLKLLDKPFSGKTTFLFFVGKNRKGKYIKIKEEISNYLDRVQTLAGGGQSVLVQELRQEINLHDWETRSFSRTNAFTMEYLTLLQQKILLIESTLQISRVGHNHPNQEKTMSGTRVEEKNFGGSNGPLNYYIY